MKTEELAKFEKWWSEEGSFCRSGGGVYEKTFAFRAWEAVLAQQERTSESIGNADASPKPKNVELSKSGEWPIPEPLHLQAITFAYEKGFAAGFSGRNTENVFAETGGQRAAFLMGLGAGSGAADRKRQAEREK